MGGYNPDPLSWVHTCEHAICRKVNFPKHVSTDKWLIVIPMVNDIVCPPLECMDRYLTMVNIWWLCLQGVSILLLNP